MQTTQRYDPLTPATAVAVATASNVVALPASAASPTRKGGLSFGKLTTAKAGDKPAHPQFPDPQGEAGLIALRIRQREQQLDALESAVETDKAELKQMVSLFYFEENRQKSAPVHTIAVGVRSEPDLPPGPPVQVQFQNRYAEGIQRDKLAAFLTEKQLADYFRETFQVKIDGAQLPEDNAQQFIDKLEALATEFNCLGAFTIKPQFKPAKTFHDARHLFLTPEQNVALNDAGFCPIIASVKASGTSRKKAA